MSSERNPLLPTPSQHYANAQNPEEVREVKGLGPLEIPRSNRWAILGGIWIANFLGVRRTISYLICFPKLTVTPVSEQCVPELFLLALLNHSAAYSYPGGNPYAVRPFLVLAH